jgi:hypothetical protein
VRHRQIWQPTWSIFASQGDRADVRGDCHNAHRPEVAHSKEVAI